MRTLLLAAAFMLAAGTSHAQTTLTLYTSQTPELAQETVDAFQAAYPDIKVNWTRNGTSALMNVLRAEIAAGQVQPDILLVADTINLGELKAGGHLMAYPKAPLEGFDPATYDKDMTYFGTKALITGIAYNTQVAKPVTTWAELLADENKGQIAMPSPLYSGAALVHLHATIDAPGIGWDFYDKLAKLDVAPEGGNGPATNAVSSGMAKYGVLVHSTVLAAKAAGSPIDFILPKDGVSIITEPVAIMSTTKQADAARKFVDFVLSRKGQELAAAQGFVPMMPGVKGPEGLPPLSEMKLLGYDLDKALSQSEAVRSRFAEIYGL